MNILFVLYHNFTTNSAPHVHALAEELQKLGHECSMAVPCDKETISVLGGTAVGGLNFEDVLSAPGRIFSDGRGPDLVHAWTPRESVRIFSQKVCEVHRCPLFVHLEDNEWHILSCFLERPLKSLTAACMEELDKLIPSWLSHPKRAVEFMQSAAGISVIIDRLAELAPRGVPILELWPAADATLFSRKAKDLTQRRELGIAQNAVVLAYTGNVHAANAHEVRSLYLAVALLNREGFPTTLVRAGRDFYPFLGPDESWARRYSIELGYIPHSDICSVLALADVLVQPGKPDEFNDYRFPSKLPEFLSVGRPVILPNTNIAKHMIHRVHGYLLEDPSGISIAAAVREIMNDKELYATLAAGSVRFSGEHLNWQVSAQSLHAFYCTSTAHTAAFLATAS